MNYHSEHLIGRPNKIVVRRVPPAPTLFYFVKQVNKSWSIANEQIQTYTHMMGYKEGFQEYNVDDCLCGQDCEDPRGYRRMDHLDIRRRPADWVCISSTERFNWCVISPCGNGHCLVVRQSELGVTSMWFAQWAYLYMWWQPRSIDCQLEW